uniref:RNA helicase n=1 Tax=Percolomonas cosmopolitus TaxID=63605 RepID=A0A7S1PGH6_9EUKA
MHLKQQQWRNQMRIDASADPSAEEPVMGQYHEVNPNLPQTEYQIKMDRLYFGNANQRLMREALKTNGQENNNEIGGIVDKNEDLDPMRLLDELMHEATRRSNRVTASHSKQQKHLLPRHILPPRTVEIANEFYVPSVGTSHPSHKIVCQKNAYTGKVEQIVELDISKGGSRKSAATSAERQDANTSMSMLRLPGARVDFVRGSGEQMPFMPGGMEEELDERHASQLDASQAEKPGESDIQQMLAKSELLTVPPGFSSGGLQAEQNGTTIQDESSVALGQNPKGLLDPFKPSAQKLEEYSNQQHQVLHDAQGNVLDARQHSKKAVIRLDDLFGAEYDEFELDLAAEDEETDEEPSEEEQEEMRQKEEHLPETYSQAESAPAETQDEISTIDHALDDLLSDMDPLAILQRRNKKKKENRWAVVDNTDVSNFRDLVPQMAIEYPFDLDDFQKRAVYHLENSESTFVAAHTSAGKTVVAEYAIALSQKHLTRIIYTSPIKTLSNQKFREFKKTFGDVGILTGDVQINPTATCLIMTTEILRSMLYKGADLIRDVEWVVFDEVHYLNDPDRGVVWEEVIIMLPKHVNLIMLSATIPNTKEFAEWVGRTKQKPMYVIQTLKRPVPLEHYIHYKGNIYKVVDSNKQFLHQNYRNCLQDKKEKDAMASKSSKKFKGGFARMKTDKNDIQNLIETLRKKSLLPVVIFSFSRKKCESLGFGLTSTDLTTGVEKSQIHMFVKDSVSRLTGSDRQLPQVLRISELVKRGIGVHHSGMLPIVKEMVEMLFSKGLVKVLFATETFAMGVNFPTKSVVFNGVRKHDGTSFRELLSSEYTQMSGRAGRRGLDTAGIVILHCSEDIVEEPSLQRMILGKSTKLQSQFKLSYNMILNLLRVEDFRVEDMLKRSFSESHNQRYLPEKTVLEASHTKLADIEDLDCIYGEPDIDNYYSLALQFEHANQTLMDHIHVHHSNLLTGGRVVTVKTHTYGNTLGVILNTTQPQSDDRLSVFFEDTSEMLYVILTLRLKTKKLATYANESCLPSFSMMNIPAKNGTEPLTDIVIVKKNKMVAISKDKLSTSNVKGIKSNFEKYVETHGHRDLGEQLIALWQDHPESGPDSFNPVTDLKMNNLEVAESEKQRKNLIAHMTQSKCCNCPKLEEQYAHKQRKYDIGRKLDTLKYALSDENLELLPEFNNRLSILEHFKYIDADKTVQLKGRVACELNSCDELVVTEMIFENFFTPFSPEECVAVLSCLICKQKDEDAPKIPERLERAKDDLIELVMTLGSAQYSAGLNVSPVDYQDVLKFGMMEVAYSWAKGVPFSDICNLTTMQEGNIVRNITQIAHACREIRNAARVIGDSSLFNKMEECAVMIKRDVIFAASLYTSEV